MNSKRGKEPTQAVKMKLCAITGGRCQLCNKFLFTDNVSLRDSNNSNLAHIVASSPDGPRGNESSYQLSDKIENLMLMCQEHHHFVDEHPELYTVERLTEIKKKREEQYSKFAKAQEIPETNIVVFRSKIKGKVDVNYSLQKMIDAFILEKIPSNQNGIDINISSKKNYDTNDYWNDVVEDLYYQFDSKIKRVIERNAEAHFSIFPLAPIPLIIKLGYLFGDKIHTEIYQKFREPDSWKWQKEYGSNEFKITTQELNDNKEAALVVSLTAEISTERVLSANSNIGKIYSITARNTGVNCIESKKDLEAFWHQYQKVCDTVVNDNVAILHIFPAVPVSAAYEIGRRFMPGVYPKMKIYEENQGFFEALTMGDNK